MWLGWAQIILLWLESGCTSLDSTEQAEGWSCTAPFPHFSLGKRPLCSRGELLSSSVCQGLESPCMAEASKYKVLLIIIMFCSSRKELLSYKSPALGHGGPDSRLHKLTILFISSEGRRTSFWHGSPKSRSTLGLLEGRDEQLSPSGVVVTLTVLHKTICSFRRSGVQEQHTPCPALPQAAPSN